MNFQAVYTVIVLSLAVSSISVTVTRSKVFAPFRAWIGARHEKLGGLFSCFYCLSHWLAAAFVLVYQPRLLSLWLPLDLVVAVFAIVTIASIFSGLTILSFRIAEYGYVSEKKGQDNVRSIETAANYGK